MSINKNVGHQILPHMTLEEALVATELDFQVAMLDGVHSLDKNGNLFSSNREKSCCRLDNGKILGIHKSRYKPIQNKELFEIGWSAQAEFTPMSAIGFDEGRRPTLFLEGKEIEVSYGDKTLSRMTITNSHDASTKFSATPSIYRIKNDTLIPLRFLSSKSQRAYTIRHDGSMEDKIENMKKALASYRKDVVDWYDHVQRLQKKTLPKGELIAFWGKIYEMLYKLPVTEEERKDAALTLKGWQDNLDKENKEPDLWIASSAVIEGIQHAVPSRKRGDWETKRIEKNILGDISDKSANIFQQAMTWLD